MEGDAAPLSRHTSLARLSSILKTAATSPSIDAQLLITLFSPTSPVHAAAAAVEGEESLPSSPHSSHVSGSSLATLEHWRGVIHFADWIDAYHAPTATWRSAQIVDTNEDWVQISFSADEEDFWASRESRLIAPFGSMTSSLADVYDVLINDQWHVAHIKQRIDDDDDVVVLQVSSLEQPLVLSASSPRLATAGTMTGPKLGLGGGPFVSGPPTSRVVAMFDTFNNAGGLDRVWTALSHGQGDAMALALAQICAAVGPHPSLPLGLVMSVLPAHIVKLGRGQARAGARLLEIFMMRSGVPSNEICARMESMALEAALQSTRPHQDEFRVRQGLDYVDKIISAISSRPKAADTGQLFECLDAIDLVGVGLRLPTDEIVARICDFIQRLGPRFPARGLDRIDANSRPTLVAALAPWLLPEHAVKLSARAAERALNRLSPESRLAAGSLLMDAPASALDAVNMRLPVLHRCLALNHASKAYKLGMRGDDVAWAKIVELASIDAISTLKLVLAIGASPTPEQALELYKVMCPMIHARLLCDLCKCIDASVAKKLMVQTADVDLACEAFLQHKCEVADVAAVFALKPAPPSALLARLVVQKPTTWILPLLHANLNACLELLPDALPDKLWALPPPDAELLNKLLARADSDEAARKLLFALPVVPMASPVGFAPGAALQYWASSSADGDALCAAFLSSPRAAHCVARALARHGVPPGASAREDIAMRALELVCAGHAVDAAASIWAQTTKPDMLTKQQSTLEECLCSCEPLARRATAFAHAPTMQSIVAKLLAQVLFSPSRLSKSDALFTLVGVEPAPGVAVQLASAITLLTRPAPLWALSRILTLDRGLSAGVIAADVAQSACELSLQLPSPMAREAARAVILSAVRANRDAALPVALRHVSALNETQPVVIGGPCPWLQRWPACPVAPSALMALYHLTPFRRAVLATDASSSLKDLFAAMQSSPSRCVDASTVLDCAGRDGELARVLSVLASLAPDASRKVLGGSLARRLTCDWCGSDEEGQLEVHEAVTVTTRGCASLGEALAKRFAPRRVIDACSACKTRGHVTERSWIKGDGAPAVCVVSLSGQRSALALDLEGQMSGYTIVGVMARKLTTNAVVVFSEVCKGEWICTESGVRSRIVPCAEVVSEREDLSIRLVLLSRVARISKRASKQAAAAAACVRPLKVERDFPDREAQVQLAAQLVSLAGPEPVAMTPLGQRQSNKVVLTPPTWWPAAATKTLVSPSRAPQPRAIEQAATACVRLALCSNVDIPSEALTALSSMSSVRDHVIAWLLRSDECLAKAVKSPLLSALLRGGPRDDDLVRRVAKDKEFWPPLSKLIVVNNSAAASLCGVSGLLRRALQGGWLDLAASLAERMPLATRAQELKGLESVVVDALCTPDGSTDAVRLAVVWPNADLAILAARALRGAEPPWEALNAAVWSAGLSTGADLLLPELYSMRRTDHVKVMAFVEWLLDRCDARPDLVLELATREPLFPKDEDRATDWIYRFLERYPREVGGPLVPKAMSLLVRLAGVHERGDLIVHRRVRFPTEDVHIACRVACARDVEETVSEGVMVRVLDDVDQARLYFQVTNGRRHAVNVLLWFNATGEEKFALPPDNMVVRRIMPGESRVLFAADALVGSGDDDDSPDWGRYEYAWEFRGDETDSRASIGGVAGKAARPSLDLVQKEFEKVFLSSRTSDARVVHQQQQQQQQQQQPLALARQSTAPADHDLLQNPVAEEDSLAEFENDPDAQWIIEGLDPFAE